jgi:hypothetical protein
MFHVKRRSRCLKKRGFWRQRGRDHLAAKRSQFVEQPLQILLVEFRGRIVQKQRGAELAKVLEHSQLGNDHGDGRQLLLAP